MSSEYHGAVLGVHVPLPPSFCFLCSREQGWMSSSATRRTGLPSFHLFILFQTSDLGCIIHLRLKLYYYSTILKDSVFLPCHLDFLNIPEYLLCSIPVSYHSLCASSFSTFVSQLPPSSTPACLLQPPLPFCI